MEPPGRLCQLSGLSIPHCRQKSTLTLSRGSAPHEYLWQRAPALGSLVHHARVKDTAGWSKTGSQWFRCSAPLKGVTTSAIIHLQVRNYCNWWVFAAN